jgi:hypothetical protein
MPPTPPETPSCRNALVFNTLYLQLLGFSDFHASLIAAFFLTGTAAGAAVRMCGREARGGGGGGGGQLPATRHGWSLCFSVLVSLHIRPNHWANVGRRCSGGLGCKQVPQPRQSVCGAVQCGDRCPHCCGHLQGRGCWSTSYTDLLCALRSLAVRVKQGCS